MKTAYGCKLFGAHQALAGIRDSLILFHSVVGCNYGTMLFHLSPCDQTDVRQTSTIINDSDIVFGGEESLGRALIHAAEVYRPGMIFVITGCVSDMIQDDVKTVVRNFERKSGIRTIAVEAAGYRGDFSDGFEEALLKLIEEMEPDERDRTADQGLSGDKSPGDCPERRTPVINIIGPGADDRCVKEDLEAIGALLNEKARLGCCFSFCTISDVKAASHADLNLVFGRGVRLAEKMKEKYGIPYKMLDYPYGFTGACALWDCLFGHFGICFDNEKAEYRRYIKEKLKGVYTFMELMYGKPAAVIGEGSRAGGLAAFLSGELGMEIEAESGREKIADMEECFREIKRTDAAVLFGSSFEQELADEMGIPLVRFDYPVFDRFVLTKRPYVGPDGELCLIEDIFNEICHARTVKGALYR